MRKVGPAENLSQHQFTQEAEDRLKNFHRPGNLFQPSDTKFSHQVTINPNLRNWASLAPVVFGSYGRKS